MNTQDIEKKINHFITNSKILSRKESFLDLFKYIFINKDIYNFSIIETGTLRGKKEEYIPGDGGSTTLWGYFCSLTSNVVYTVDICPEAIETCRFWTKEYVDYIKYVNEDSVGFLSKYFGKIDLLYLDSFDSPPDLIEQASIHQFNEINTIFDNLEKGTMILLDDAPEDLSGGKVKYSVKFLNSKNAQKIYHKDGQILYIK